MTLSSQTRDVFAQSNIRANYREHNLKLLDAALAESGVRASEILAVSLADAPQQLVVVTEGGILAARGRGLVRFRADVEYYPYSVIEVIAEAETHVDRRPASVLEIVGSNSVPLARFAWAGWDLDESDARDGAKRERDRVLQVALRVFQTE